MILITTVIINNMMHKKWLKAQSKKLYLQQRYSSIYKGWPRKVNHNIFPNLHQILTLPREI